MQFSFKVSLGKWRCYFKQQISQYSSNDFSEKKLPFKSNYFFFFKKPIALNFYPCPRDNSERSESSLRWSFPIQS